MSSIWKILQGLLVACWVSISIISLNHLYPFYSGLSQLPSSFLGGLGWSTALLAVLYLSRENLHQVILLAVGVFILGCLTGPFLEPPADPLEHLRRMHEETCGNEAGQIARQNRGMWHYSMVGVLLCTDGNQVQPKKMLQRIDITNGLLWALCGSVLFVLATQGGLSFRWAVLSVFICFLFFGTNRFSYIRYYNFAPGFSSILVYWLWTALFFFKKTARDVVTGLAVALLSIPVLWVNHSQEAVFLGFIVCIWVLLSITFTWGKRTLLSGANNDPERDVSRKHFTINQVGVLCIVIACWLLPQFDVFLQWLSQFFIRNYGDHNQSLAVIWNGLYVGGRVDGLRVVDTLGMTGVLMVLVSLPYFWPGYAEGAFEKKVRIYILAVLPFIGYFTPLFHFVWSSNVKSVEYYRLCYTSMFWILFADFFCSVEKRVCLAASKLKFLCKV